MAMSGPGVQRESCRAKWCVRCQNVLLLGQTSWSSPLHTTRKAWLWLTTWMGSSWASVGGEELLRVSLVVGNPGLRLGVLRVPMWLYVSDPWSMKCGQQGWSDIGVTTPSFKNNSWCHKGLNLFFNAHVNKHLCLKVNWSHDLVLLGESMHALWQQRHVCHWGKSVERLYRALHARDTTTSFWGGLSWPDPFKPGWELTCLGELLVTAALLERFLGVTYIL